MNRCEHFETLVSTWLDGALDRGEQIDCVDHLVRCDACRKFYIDARALDGLLAAVRTPDHARVPATALWPRVAGAVRPARRVVPVWMLQAAAVAILAVGLYLVTWRAGGVPPSAPASEDIAIGRGGTMTDTRFVELTREVLRADPRYVSAMRQVLDQVVRDAVPSEASGEDVAVPAVERNVQDPETRRHMPA